jgi:hypothetical protein
MTSKPHHQSAPPIEAIHDVHNRPSHEVAESNASTGSELVPAGDFGLGFGTVVGEIYVRFNQKIVPANFGLFIKEPFPVFEIENFLSPDEYRKLRDEFPEKKLFPHASSRGNKSRLDNQHMEFFEFMKTSAIWRSFHELFYRPEVVEQCFKLTASLPSERPAHERFPWKLVGHPNRRRASTGHAVAKSFGRWFRYTPVTLGFEFSYLDNGCFIPPHTDNVSKLISLIVYFPDESVDYGSTAGTDFFRGIHGSKAWNEWSVSMLDEERAAVFYKEHETFHSSLFTGNKLVGFLKTSNSWHGLKALNIPDGAARRSVNINYYAA